MLAAHGVGFALCTNHPVVPVYLLPLDWLGSIERSARTPTWCRGAAIPSTSATTGRC